MNFRPIKPFTRLSYFGNSIGLLIIVSFFNLSILLPDYSVFWGRIVVSIIFLWIIWVLIATAFKLYEKLIFRFLPPILLLNFSFFLWAIPLWRFAKEEEVLGSMICFFFVVANLFSFRYAKELLSRTIFTMIPKLLVFLFLLIAPLIWGGYCLNSMRFSVELIKYCILSSCGYYLTMFFTAVTICYREPDWTPEKELNRKDVGKGM